MLVISFKYDSSVPLVVRGESSSANQIAAIMFYLVQIRVGLIVIKSTKIKLNKLKIKSKIFSVVTRVKIAWVKKGKNLFFKRIIY